MDKAINLEALDKPYDAIFCDVWGVVHNGVQAFKPAVDALKRAKNSGKTVVLLTNSPRPHQDVEEQLLKLSVDEKAYDFVVTSGDATRTLIAEVPRKLFHIGPDRDLGLFDGLNVDLVEEFEAAAIVCTGLFDDVKETPDDYVELLHRLRSRNLPFICANPDIIVHRGQTEIWCAGALARDYGLLGGRTLIAGKPHRPIYDLAYEKVTAQRGMINKSKILAIGDGLLTDVKGGEHFGIDVLFILGGIHYLEYSENGHIYEDKLFALVNKFSSHPIATMWSLQ
ncbi:TIGR01459 family HAD-type hydrolase [Bartonella tamiae]|uniref:TIGR01459 family HAD-type hydrolase n=1 Tax=Bartonella tamiae TaxID=373638 RepID=UPI00026E6C01|nr:TIGR01459 family HAD-type hydrolase [Bartonella tamiae]EJF93715.1 TIGR01459 family HAD hydrolase [Bartonella tamiae Th307]